MLDTELSALFGLVDNWLAGDENLVCSRSPHSGGLGGVGIPDEDSIPGLVYVRFRSLLDRDVGPGSATKDANVFNVLPDFCLCLFEDDD